MGSPDPTRHPVWARLPFLTAVLSDEGEWVFAQDTDSMVINLTRPLEAVLSESLAWPQNHPGETSHSWWQPRARRPQRSNKPATPAQLQPAVQALRPAVRPLGSERLILKGRKLLLPSPPEPPKKPGPMRGGDLVLSADFNVPYGQVSMQPSSCPTVATP